MSQTPKYFTPEELEPISEYIDRTWAVTTAYQPHDQGTLIGLPKPYIVPSSRITHGFSFSEMYYWDSYFIARGLYGTRHRKMAGNMLDNLLYLQRRFGIIPNANRFYFLSRSQPPFLTSYIFDVYEQLHRGKKWLSKAMAVAESEYLRVWMSEDQPNSRRVYQGLSRYYDINVIQSLAEAESGWDMNPRFGGEALDYLPVDLNALLYKYEKDFEKVNLILGHQREAAIWAKRAYRRKATMNQLMWDKQAGFFFDFNFLSGQRSPVWSLAAYFPLWAGMVSQAQAESLVKNLKRFNCPGGLATTDQKSAASSQGRPLQWEYPNGWAPLQMIAVEGLIKYGFRAEADEIVRAWLSTNLLCFKQHGALYEKYNVAQPGEAPQPGLYPSQEGFSWTNAVFSRFCQDYLLPQERPSLQSRPKPAQARSMSATWSPQADSQGSTTR